MTRVSVCHPALYSHQFHQSSELQDKPESIQAGFTNLELGPAPLAALVNGPQRVMVSQNEVPVGVWHVQAAVCRELSPGLSTWIVSS